MISEIFQNWSLYIVRGLLAITFGILALICPDKTILVLILLFGCYTMVDGFLTIITGITSLAFNDRWWAVLLEGAFEFFIALVTIFQPQITAQVLLFYVTAWAIISGIFKLLAAVHFQGVVKERLVISNGVLSIVVGVLMIIFSGLSAIALIWLIAGYALIYGVLLIVYSLRMRKLWHAFKETDRTLADASQLLNWWMQY